MARKKTKATKRVDFFKYNPATDGEQTFNIDKALNENWDKTADEFERLGESVENIDVSWDGITGKPETFPPSEHNHDDRYYTESEIDTKLNGKANAAHTHTKSQITDFPASLPASDVYSWAKQPSKPTYTASEVGALPSGGTAVNSSKLGGYTLEQIKQMCGGDIVGKNMIVLPKHDILKATLAQWTYSNSKGGMIRLLFPSVYSSIRLTIVVDGQTIVTDTTLGVFCGCYGGVDAYFNYSVDIPFTNNVTIQPTYAHYDKIMYPVAYINK